MGMLTKGYGGLIPQPGRTLVLRGDGSATGTVKYISSSPGLGGVPGIGSAHPDHSEVQCYAVSVTFLENGLSEITCEYLGIFRDPTDPVVEFIGNVSEEPIETHPDFVSRLGGTAKAPKNKAQFDEETGEFLGFPADAPNNLGGVRGYLNPACTVRVSWFTKNADSAEGLGSLGSIASPPAGVPSAPDSKNWLKTNWSRRQFGLIYQITEEYTASGRKGWNPLIYA